MGEPFEPGYVAAQGPMTVIEGECPVGDVRLWAPRKWLYGTSVRTQHGTNVDTPDS